jgi:acetyltransferase-like isoleucine patch superfamily enzyme
MDIPNLHMDESATIALTAVIGAPYRKLLEGDWDRLDRPISIDRDCSVGHFCVVGDEATLGAGTILDNYVLVEPGATVGSRVLATHRATIGVKATVGDDCVIAGHIGERARVGDRCRVFGDLVHRQLDPGKPWDAEEAQEASPMIEDDAFVGWRATIVGPVTIGRGAYVCAGAIVTRSVPDGMIVRGVNEVRAPEEWQGKLGESEYFVADRSLRVPVPV